MLFQWQYERVIVRAALLACERVPKSGGLRILYPLDETIFPPEIGVPTFRWEAPSSRVDRWVVAVRFPDNGEQWNFPVSGTQWRPLQSCWETIKKRSVQEPIIISVVGINPSVSRDILCLDRVRVWTSRDEVGAPIFYREVILPFIEAVKDPSRLRWRFGTISSETQPPVVLEKLPVCGNCHSFSADGRTLAMDVDYANDKGSYIITPVGKEITLATNKIISWSDYRREDGQPTYGLLSQVSPDGRYVVSTVKDRSIFVARPDLAFSQLFFPFKGILVVYNRESGRFSPLKGADDPQYVQSNACWSPDGREIVFARTQAYQTDAVVDNGEVLLSNEDCERLMKGGRPFRYDLYRIPFNDGKGGRAEPLMGASGNGFSNYFPRYSPDGRWIVFCRASNFMLLQPDSELWIIPAVGGTPRRLRCNLSRMNSWHSWSPNGRWLVFSSKGFSIYTQLFLTHMDDQGNSSPPVLLENFTSPDRAANIPEFVNSEPTAIRRIHEQFVNDNSYVHLGHQLLVSKDNAKALAAFEKALKLNPQNLGALNLAASVLCREGRIAESTNLLQTIIRIAPDKAAPHFNLGIILSKIPEHGDEVIQHFRRGLQLDPNNGGAHNLLGKLLMERGEYLDAESHFQKAVRCAPNNVEARANLGQLLANRNRFAEAASQFSAVLSYFPDDSSSLLRLEECYARLGEFRKAISVAEHFLGLARKSGDEERAADAVRRIDGYRRHLSNRKSPGSTQ
jgi:tetratricopeptide (TPR) repeat protein